MFRLLRALRGRTPLLVAVVAVVITARGLRRMDPTTRDSLPVRLLLAVDAGLIAWAVWDEVVRRRGRR